MELSDLISPEAVLGSAKAESKKRALLALCAEAAQLCGMAEAEIYGAVQEREHLGPTGMGKGIAIPHARLAGLDRVVGCFARLAKPVDYESVDGQPVDLIFLLLAPENAGAEHLKALARVARVLRDPVACDKLRSTSDPSALFAILTESRASRAA